MWLLGERKKSLQDLDEGLDENGPIYDAIMNNSYIRLSLNNPKILLGKNRQHFCFVFYFFCVTVNARQLCHII